MIRVLHIIGSMNRAGAETFIMNLYRSLDKNNIQFDFYCTSGKKGDFDEEILDLGGRIFYAEKSNPLINYVKFYKFLSKHKEYKIVHAHILLSIGLYALISKFSGVKKIISHSHSSSYRAINNIYIKNIYYKISTFLIQKNANVFLACGKEAGYFLYPNIRSFEIINNTIDLKAYKKYSEENSDYLSVLFNDFSEYYKIIQVGRFNKVKNHDFTVNIIDKLKNRNKKFVVFFIGDGELRSEIELSIKAKKLDKYVKFLGVRNDVPQIMSGADLLLMPSHFEGFPVVLIESQAIGLKSIISNNISKEVDLGVNLIKALPIDDVECWVEEIDAEIVKSNDKTISDFYYITLLNKGFDSTAIKNKFYNIYNS